MSKHLIAYTFADGSIHFGHHLPVGALSVGEGPAEDLRETVTSLARQAREEGVLLVPGIPEAKDPGIALRALLDFRRHVLAALANQGEAA